jgi:hypothetical protein
MHGHMDVRYHLHLVQTLQMPDVMCTTYRPLYRHDIPYVRKQV